MELSDVFHVVDASLLPDFTDVEFNFLMDDLMELQYPYMRGLRWVM